jgi:exodeoxyribonuclease VII small subunit
MKKEKPTFEESLLRLEAIVKQLDDASLPLQQGLALYEEGMSLSLAMKRELAEVEKKVKVLQKNAAGIMEEVDFAGDDGESP